MNKVSGSVAIINTSYKWTISNFSKYITTDSEEIFETTIESPIFSSKKNNVVYKWQLQLYDLDSNFFDLRIKSHNKQEITLRVKLSFLDYNNKEVQQCAELCKFTKVRDSFATDFYVEKNAIAYEQIDVLRDDQLTIKCELISDSCSLEQEIDLSEGKLDCLEKLVGNKKFSDLEIVLDDGRTLHAHMNLLACKSATFASMIDAEEKENVCKITVKDMYYEVCKEMLRYIYAGKVKGLDAFAHQLSAAADKYSITGLKNLCETFLCNHIALDNLIDNLNTADECNMSSLKENVLAFIAKNRKLVIKEPAFKLLGYRLPSKLIFELLCAIVNVDE